MTARIGVVAMAAGVVVGPLTIGPLGAQAASANANCPASSPTSNWLYGADLLTANVSGKPTNGGCPQTSSSSSSSSSFPEEGAAGADCPPSGSAGADQCGRGEFGGPEDFSSLLLNNNDDPSVTFGCPSTQNGTTAATTTGTGSGAKPALLFLSGNAAGGDQTVAGIQNLGSLNVTIQEGPPPVGGA